MELKLYKHLDKLTGISAVTASAKRVIRQKQLAALSDT